MTTAFQLNVGARIRALRERSGLTQREFAARAGFNPAFTGRIERGLQNLTLAGIGRVAMALGVPVAALFDGVALTPKSLEPKPAEEGTPPETKAAVDTALDEPGDHPSMVPPAKGVDKRRKGRPGVGGG